MNKRKGFFRLTLVLSILCGALTLCFLVIGNGKTFEEKWISIPSLNGQTEEFLKKMDWSDDAFEAAVWKAFRDLEKEGDVIDKPELEKREDVFHNLSLKEKQKAKEIFKKDISGENRKLFIFDPYIGCYCTPFGRDWTKISRLILVGFFTGFASIWLIYAVIKWVVIGFIVGGFKDRSTP